MIKESYKVDVQCALSKKLHMSFYYNRQTERPSKLDTRCFAKDYLQKES